MTPTHIHISCLLTISVFSDPPRHRAHGQVPHPGVRVPREGPQAVHGRLRRHPGNEQCQAFPLPGKQNILSTLWIESTQLVFFTDSSEPTMKRSTCHWYYVLRTSELGIFVFYGQRRKACALLYLYYLNIWELNKVLYYRTLYPHKKNYFSPLRLATARAHTGSGHLQTGLRLTITRSCNQDDECPALSAANSDLGEMETQQDRN